MKAGMLVKINVPEKFRESNIYINLNGKTGIIIENNTIPMNTSQVLVDQIIHQLHKAYLRVIQ